MNRTKSQFTGCILGLGLLLAAGQSAHALQASWDVPFTPSAWTRGTTPGSLYAEWNVFNDNLSPTPAGVQDTTPEVANFGGGTYNVAETTGGSFLTSGNNIYSPFNATQFQFTVGNAASGSGDVYLHIASLGNFNTTLQQAFTNFTLNGIAGTYQELFREVTSITPPGAPPSDSYEIEALVSWLGVTHAPSFVLGFDAIGPHASLDQLSLDVGPVAPVPLPAAAYFMATGLVGLWTMARRKKASRLSS